MPSMWSWPPQIIHELVFFCLTYGSQDFLMKMNWASSACVLWSWNSVYPCICNACKPVEMIHVQKIVVEIVLYICLCDFARLNILILGRGISPTGQIPYLTTFLLSSDLRLDKFLKLTIHKVWIWLWRMARIILENIFFWPLQDAFWSLLDTFGHY